MLEMHKTLQEGNQVQDLYLKELLGALGHLNLVQLEQCFFPLKPQKMAVDYMSRVWCCQLKFFQNNVKCYLDAFVSNDFS